MKFKKTLVSLVCAGAMALSSANTKATLIPFEQSIPDSYSFVGDIVNQELAVDGDFDTYAENSLDKFNFTIFETYNKPIGATSADFTSEFQIGRYSQANVDYSINNSGIWMDLYDHTGLDAGSFQKTLNHSFDDLSGIDKINFRSSFNSPFSLSSDTYYNESKVSWLPEPATIALLGLGASSLCLFGNKK